MKVDLYTKTVLTVIAVALSSIALKPWIVPNQVLGAPDVEHIVRKIQRDASSMSDGLCLNSKIC